MKKLKAICVLSLFICMVSTRLCAQQTTLEVDNQSPGWLSSKIGYADQLSVENLKITGYLNSDDLRFIASMVKNNSLHGRLDLYDVNIVGDTSSKDNYFVEDSKFFGGSTSCSLKYFSYPREIKGGDNYALRALSVDTLYIKTKSATPKMFGLNAKHVIIGEGMIRLRYPALYSVGATTIESIELPSTLKEIGEYKSSPISISNIKITIKNGRNLKEFPSLERFVAQFEVEEMPDSVFFPNIKVLSLNQYFNYHANSMFKKGMHVFIGNKIDTLTDMSNAYGIHLHFASPNPPAMEGSEAYHYQLENRADFILHVPKGSANAYRNCFKDGGTKVTVIEEDVDVSKVELNKHTIELLTGETINLSASILPYNASEKTLKWQSSDNTIAEVDENGLVKAKKGGKAIITVSSISNPEVSDKCEVCVIQPVLSIKLSEAAVTLSQNVGTCQLTALASPEDATDKSVIWSSSNTDIADVNDNGFVTAKKVGKAIIMATATSNPEAKDYCEVTVAQPVTGIDLDKTSITFASPGETSQLTATIVPTDASNKNIRWFSSNQAICTVSESGIVVATGPGNAIVTATSVDGGFVATCAITVLQPVTGITIDKRTLDIRVGSFQELRATVSPDNASDKSVTWSSSDNNVASVSESGIVTAHKAGKTTITVAANSNNAIKDYCEVNVLQPVTGITISESVINFSSLGSTKQLIATVIPDDASNKSIKWASSNTSVCTVSDNGFVIGVGPGTSVISVTTVDGGFVAVCIVTLNDTSGIMAVKLDKLTGKEKIYDIQGKRQDSLRKGLNIIHMSDGSIIKVYIKLLLSAKTFFFI